MGRKKLKSLAAFLATMSASFFIPLVVNAGDCTSISATECIGGCNGHVISQANGNHTKRIQVSGGRHTITLDNVAIDTSSATDEADQFSAFDITGDATVELILIGDNTLKSFEGYAGLHIPSGSYLTIKGDGNLRADGGVNGAGIGSQGIDGASGQITIATGKTSTITANGGDAAAGIGGGQGGGCGKIIIESGNVEAKGGDGYTVTNPTTNVTSKVAGGTGIGTGGGGVGGGDIVLKGGEITAIGGMSNDDPQRNGIDCQKLSSDGGSANLYSNSPISDTTNIDDFNGVVWLMVEETTGSGVYKTVSGNVYGNAVLDKDLKDISITIRSGCSLTIPSNTKVTISGTGSIMGDTSTSIINADNLIVAGKVILSPDIEKKVTLDKKDIAITNPNLVYTGKDLGHTDKNSNEEAYKIISPRHDNGTTYTVDETGWVPHYYKNGLLVDKIQNAGTYNVIYKNTNPNANYSDFSFNITVEKRQLESSMVKDIDDVLFTGSAQQPKVTLTYNNKELVEGVDYQPLTSNSYSNNIEVGDNTATVTIDASANGNFLGSVEKKFSIKPAVLLEENVTITPETTVYNGKKQEPTIQVLLEDGSEMDKDNYTVTASTDNFTDATGSEPIVFTIEGKGNFSGKITKNYTISEAPLTITKIKPKDRQYNGSKEVEIEEVQFTGLLGTDKPSDITLESKGLVESENVNESGYSTITFDEFKLGGEKGKNYVVQSPLPGEAIVLDKPVIISQADAPATPDIKCTYEVSATYPGKFVGTMSVANAADGAEYQYRWKAKDSEEFTEWQTDNVFDNIVPGETWIVEAQSVGNENIKQSEIGQAEITFEKLTESRVPEGITMEFALNKDGETYTATVLPELPELEYFIGKSDEVPGDDDYLSAESGRNPHMKTDCEAATEYTAYVRFKETATHKASEPTKVTGVTETLVVKEPTISLVRNESSDESDNKGDANNEDSNEEANARESSADDITLNDNEYLETGKVKITCKTKGATIYYTTDGTDPTDQDNEYTGPFEISNKGETTIKAFAIKDGREDSPTASATFIRRLLNVETPIITPEDGESFTGSTLVTIECPTEGADIYYTTDGSEPDPTNKKQKYKEPFRINTSTTINAIGVMKDMDPSEMATSSLEKLESTVNVYSSLISFATTGEDAQNNPISDELMEKLGTKDKKVASESIVAQLTSELSVIGSNGDFTYDRMRFYDLVLKVKVDSEPLRDATADDFSEGGLTVTVPYPEGTSLEANDFAIAHMFGSGENTGKIETWQNITVTKTPSGLQFTVTSASPLAIAWTTAVPNGPNSNNVSGGDNVVDPDDPNGDGQGDNQGDGQGDNQGDGQGDNQGDVTVTANPRDGGTGDGTTTDNSNGTGTGTGTGAAADAVKSAAASLLPKTGDTSKLIVWVVLAVACVAVIVGIQIKSKKGNRKK